VLDFGSRLGKTSEMRLRTIVTTSSMILRIIATIPNCSLILIAGTCFIGCVVEARSGADFWLWPIGFAAIHLLAIWFPSLLKLTALKMILRIIVTVVDCVLIPLVVLLFVGSNIVETSLGRVVVTFLLVLLFIGFAMINLLAIWLPALLSFLATRVDPKETNKQGR